MTGGDRLTLETAARLADVGDIIDAIDAQLAWLDDEGANHSAPGPWASLSIVNKRLRQAVRAYRERLPEPAARPEPPAGVAWTGEYRTGWACAVDACMGERLPASEDGPSQCEWGHNGNDDGAKPCDGDGNWRTNCGRVFCDEHATMAASSELDAAAWVRVRADGDSGGFERGPTEGASDDGPPLRVKVDGLEVRASDEYSVHMSGFAFEGHEGGMVGELHVGSVTSPGTVLISMAEGASDAAPCSCMAKVMVHDDGSRSCTECLAEWPGRPPTGGASPEPPDTFACDGLHCPECGGFTVFGYMLRNDAGKHMHTRYVCSRWRSDGGRCGWSGWTVPDPAPDFDPIAAAASGLGVPASVYQAATEKLASPEPSVPDDFDVLACDDLDEVQYQTRGLASILRVRGMGTGSSCIELAREVYGALLTIRNRERAADERRCLRGAPASDADVAKGSARPGVDVGMRSIDDWRSNATKADGATSMRERVESALADIEVELATKHAKRNGVHYTDALGLCLKWVRAALDPQDV